MMFPNYFTLRSGWPAVYSTAWVASDLKAKDDLFNYFTGSGITAGDFTFTSHTFTHENMDNTSASDIDNELKVNLKMAGPGYLNLVRQGQVDPIPGNFDNLAFILHAGRFSVLELHEHGHAADQRVAQRVRTQDASRNGITTIVGDNSRPAITPTNPYDFWVSTVNTSNYAGYTVIPRWPCHGERLALYFTRSKRTGKLTVIITPLGSLLLLHSTQRDW